MQNTTIVWLSIDLMCKSELQSVYKFDTYEFYFFPQNNINQIAHTSIDML